MTPRTFGVGPTFLAIACALISVAGAHFLRPYAQLSDLAMIQLLGIVLVSVTFSVRDSLIACAAGIVAFDFLCIPPHFAFAWTDAKSSLFFVAMLVVAWVTSTLTQRMRHLEQVARTAAFRAESLHNLNVELSVIADTRQLAAVTVRHLEKLFTARVTILLRNQDGTFDFPRDVDTELAERAWVRREYTMHQGPAGAAIWLPLVGIHAPLGVLGLRLQTGFERDSKQGALLSDCANQFAISTERIQLTNAVRRTELETEAERNRNSLLSAISHDLKTPLAAMIAAGSTLLERRERLDAAVADQLLSSIVSEGDRLSRLIQNLLSISRLESPTIELRRSAEAVDEIVAVAVDRFGAQMGKTPIRVALGVDLPLVSVEPLLIEQVLLNLLENAFRYAGADASIEIRATAQGSVVTVQVADDGPGIPEDEREKVFEKFYRGRVAGKNDGGAGLGLTICRAIVRAHGGRVVAREKTGRGTVVEFTLPVAPQRGILRQEEATEGAAAQ